MFQLIAAKYSGLFELIANTHVFETKDKESGQYVKLVGLLTHVHGAVAIRLGLDVKLRWNLSISKV